MNTQELIATIRLWQVLNIRYLAAVAESPHCTSQRRRVAVEAMDVAAQVVTGCNHEDRTLAAFVALADIVEPALKLAATVERHQLPYTGKSTHEFSLHGESHGWIDEDVREGAFTGFLGALIELVQAVEKEGSNHG